MLNMVATPAVLCLYSGVGRRGKKPFVNLGVHSCFDGKPGVFTFVFSKLIILPFILEVIRQSGFFTNEMCKSFPILLDLLKRCPQTLEERCRKFKGKPIFVSSDTD